jgi:xanthine dehydrogenase accessory factor
MAVGGDGELVGSIGGGVMEVSLVEESRLILRDAANGRRGDAETSILSEQVHRKDSRNSSGMICSGKQTVVFQFLTPENVPAIQSVISNLEKRVSGLLTIGPNEFRVMPPEGGTQNPDFTFEKLSDIEFIYTEQLGPKNDLYVIGGGHCALALCELMSKMDFYISLFDDRPGLNTIEKNEYADAIKIVDSYERIGDHIPSGVNAFVVVMTLGYKTDESVIRGLIHKEFKYFGVLGSKAKMSTMFRSLREDGISDNRLNNIHTPVGLPINSRTPEEIAVSIAAEIISVKNGKS